MPTWDEAWTKRNKRNNKRMAKIWPNFVCFCVLVFSRLPICDSFLCRLFCSSLTFFCLSYARIVFKTICLRFYFPDPSVIISQNNNIVALLESFGWNECTKKFCLVECLTSSCETFEKRNNIANFTPSQHLEIIGSLWLLFFLFYFISDALCDQVRLDAIWSKNKDAIETMRSTHFLYRNEQQYKCRTSYGAVHWTVCVCVCVHRIQFCNSRHLIQFFFAFLFRSCSFPSLCFIGETLSLP